VTHTVNKSLAGRCGLYCGACAIYRAERDGGEYLKGLATHFQCPPEKVRCAGCQDLKPDSWGYNCKIVKCLRGKDLEFCYQCGNYRKNKCDKYAELAKGYMEDGVDIRANLERIKKGEVENWLRQNEERFKCPACRKPLPESRIKKECYHCGADLSKSA
jgi:hypothetical protein